MISKGDIVRICAIVQTKYVRYPVSLLDIAPYGKMIHKPKGGGLLKCLFRSTCANLGIVVGHSYRATGWYGYQEEDCPAHLMEDKRHKVIMLQPLDVIGRYYKPFACLEEDLVVVLAVSRLSQVKKYITSRIAALEVNIQVGDRTAFWMVDELASVLRLLEN